MTYARMDASPTHQGHRLPGFFRRWFLSTNHNDIGTLYLTFAMCTGLIRGTLSVLMRYQLMRPGNEPGKGVHGYLVCHHGTIRPAEAPTWAGEDWINRQFDTVDAQLWNLGSMSAS